MAVDRRVVISDHAASEALRRGISIDTVLAAVAFPEQRLPARFRREVRQARFVDGVSGKLFLLRAVVEPGRDADLVVTVYRTSKIAKYWRAQ